ncbi:MAG: MATE family efflux transporter [Alphaproteobacteria bacterium]|nr:MATE family efflux transporter [Alphaproteobacteria bacterium]MBQ9235474.1 MATE family efflux transporter [Alphaproteobacteria bacterium]
MIKNLTKGSPLKLIVMFAMPILIGNLFQQLFHISDILIVGRLLGVKSLAAVGSSAPLIFMFLMVAFGFTSGLTIITAQRFGAHDEKGIKSSVFHSLTAAGVLSLTVSTFFIACLRYLLRYMNIPEEIMDQAYSFTLILGLAMTPVILYNLLSGFIRALGDAKTPLYFLIFCSLINIALNFVFIYYCGLGVAGSALGSCCSMLLTVAACVWIIAKRFPLLKISLADCRYNHKFMLEHLKVAAPMAVQFSILALSMMIIQSVCNSFGTEVIAGFTAALRIEQISTQPVFAIGVAFATYAAQNYGAALIKRIRQGVRQCLAACLVLSVLISLGVRFFGTHLVGAFIEGGDEGIITIGQQYLMISSYFYFFLACIFITRNALQGMGRPSIPLASGVFELIIRAFAAVYLANIIGYYGIFWAGPIAWVGGALVTSLGYWWTITHLNNGDMRGIFARKKALQKAGC